MDFAYLMKKEPKTKASGDLLTELKKKTKPQILSSNLEAKLEETPRTPTSSSLNPQKKKTESQQLPNSFPPSLANHPSNLDHWLEQWHKLHPQPPSPTVWWPERWELEYPTEETPVARKEYSGPFSPLCTVEEMEVEMILLNLTDEILESAKQEGREVVEVLMNPMMGMEGVAVEADLIQQAVQTRPTKGHYRTRWSGRNPRFSQEIETKWKNS